MQYYNDNDFWFDYTDSEEERREVQCCKQRRQRRSCDDYCIVPGDNEIFEGYISTCFHYLYLLTPYSFIHFIQNYTVRFRDRLKRTELATDTTIPDVSPVREAFNEAYLPFFVFRYEFIISQDSEQKVMSNSFLVVVCLRNVAFRTIFSTALEQTALITLLPVLSVCWILFQLSPFSSFSIIGLIYCSSAAPLSQCRN